MDIASIIDHAVLKPDATSQDLVAGCELVVELEVFALCVRPCDVAEGARILSGAKPLICSVIGFPHGTSTTQAKVFECGRAIEDGAVEIDMVLNIGALKEWRLSDVEAEIRAVVKVAGGLPVKVIFENCLLSQQEKLAACQVSEAAGAAFVKTSTGFAASGATEEDVRLMRANVGQGVQVKASGGIRDFAQAKRMLEAGATRIGTTSTAAIVSACRGMLPG